MPGVPLLPGAGRVVVRGVLVDGVVAEVPVRVAPVVLVSDDAPSRRRKLGSFISSGRRGVKKFRKFVMNLWSEKFGKLLPVKLGAFTSWLGAICRAAEVVPSVPPWNCRA